MWIESKKEYRSKKYTLVIVKENQANFLAGVTEINDYLHVHLTDFYSTNL